MEFPLLLHRFSDSQCLRNLEDQPDAPRSNESLIDRTRQTALDAILPITTTCSATIGIIFVGVSLIINEVCEPDCDANLEEASRALFYTGFSAAAFSVSCFVVSAFRVIRPLQP